MFVHNVSWDKECLNIAQWWDLLSASKGLFGYLSLGHFVTYFHICEKRSKHWSSHFC